MKRINRTSLFIYCLLVILTIPAIFPLFHKGFFVTDDAEWMIIRLSAFYQALTDGQIPVRFLGRLNSEYGYPVATFLYPAFMYLGSFIHILRIDFIDTVKIILGLSMIGSMLFTYLWLRNFFDEFSAIVGCMMYVYMPYHLYDLYTRGSVGELLAISILPFIFWQIERKSVFWTTAGTGFLILSHNTLALLFLILLICYMLLDYFFSKEKMQMFYIAVLLLAFGLTCFYWLPVVIELPYTVFSKTTVSDWQEYFAPVSITGYVAIFTLVCCTLLFILKRAELKKHRLTLLLFVFGVSSTFFASPQSKVFWHVIPASFIQFPFRFLSITVVSVAFISAYIASVLPSWQKRAFVLINIILLSTTAYSYITHINYFDKGEGFYVTNSATTTVHDEYMPLWVKQKPQSRPEKKAEMIQGQGIISNVISDNRKIAFTADMPNKNGIVRVNTIYWPGWIAKSNGKNIAINYTNNKGLMDIYLPKGKSNTSLVFHETGTRLFSDIISIISLIALIFIARQRKYIGKK